MIAPPRLTMPVMRLVVSGMYCAQHAGVDGHVIHALRGLLLDHFQHDFGGEVFHAADARERLVDRHGADGDRRVRR